MEKSSLPPSKKNSRITTNEDSKKHIKAIVDCCHQKSLPALDKPAAERDHIFGSCSQVKGTKVKKTENTPNKVAPKIDLDRINELDAFDNQHQYYQFPLSRTFMNHLLKPQSNFVRKPAPTMPKDNKPSVAGPSNIKRKKKSADEEHFEDIKSFANCLLENTLNSLHCDERRKQIEDLKMDLIKIVETDTSLENSAAEEILPSIPILKREEGQCSLAITDAVAVCNTVCNIEEEEVARASQEVLFDPNSQTDFLEDFDVPPLLSDPGEQYDANNSLVIIGVNMHNYLQDENEAVIPINGNNGFPDWLLQMLGANVIGPEDAVDVAHDEPHFYCQGDGLGVHPSVIAVEVDEDDEASSESSSSAGTLPISGENVTTVPGASITTDTLPEDLSSLGSGSMIPRTEEYAELPVLEVGRGTDSDSDDTVYDDHDTCVDGCAKQCCKHKDV